MRLGSESSSVLGVGAKVSVPRQLSAFLFSYAPSSRVVHLFLVLHILLSKNSTLSVSCFIKTNVLGVLLTSPPVPFPKGNCVLIRMPA